MPIYNKLVRDRIPEIIESTNKKYFMRTFEASEHEVEIKRKLIEELKEYQTLILHKKIAPSSMNGHARYVNIVCIRTLRRTLQH